MNLFLKWTMVFVGLAIIGGTIIFGISANRSVPAGVDLGFEIFYLIAVLVGGLLIYLSTKVKISQTK